MRRHNAARNVVGQFAEAAGHHPELEKPGLLQPCPEQPNAARRRPADVFLPSWTGGAPAALDLAVTSPQRQDLVQLAGTRAGAAAESYEAYKRMYLQTAEDCASSGMAFVPMVAETSGGWGPSAMCTLKAFARAAAIRSDSEPGVVLAERLQHLCTAIRRANARAVLRRASGAERAAPLGMASALGTLAAAVVQPEPPGLGPAGGP